MMLVLFVPFAILFGWLLYEGVKPSLTATNATPAGNKDPLEILKLRYARGEVNKTEYTRIKQDLS